MDAMCTCPQGVSNPSCEQSTVHILSLLLLIHAFSVSKKNLNASKPSNQSKGFGGNNDCGDRKLYMVLKGFPNVVT